MSFLPKPLTDQGGIWATFSNFINDQYDFFYNKIISLKYLFTAERTTFPNELANLVGAYISPSDSVQTIRKKIGMAISTHKKLPVFSNTYKPIIDAILNVNSQIVQHDFIPEIFIIDQSLIDGNSFIETMSAPAGQDKSKGQVFIDVTRAVTTGEREKLVSQLRDICILYFFIYVGYSVYVTNAAFVIDASNIDGAHQIDNNIPQGTYFQPLFLLNE